MGVIPTLQTSKRFEEILTPEAISFLTHLHKKFEQRRQEILAKRLETQKKLDSGMVPHFLGETIHIRDGHWKISSIPEDLQDRRVEITGPVDRKMVINALNSGAKVFMADFEDSHSPTWEATLEGQINVRDAAKGEMTYTSPEGKSYQLSKTPSVLVVRPRGWHMVEKHFEVDQSSISASLFDFGLYFFHNAKTLLQKGSGPYFYLPKLESHVEARLWNDVFVESERYLDIPVGKIKATVLIETIMAAFEMDEILYELKDHVVGLNCGRWDYIFSMIKRLKNHPHFILPDRAKVTMTTPCMRSYSLLAIQTCHKRGALAIGGMAAQIPIKNDVEANTQAMEKVRLDKRREVEDGHDGTWVAHPGLIAVALKEFNEKMKGANQVDRLRNDVQITEEHLLQIPVGTITEEGLRTNIRVGVQYLDAWLKGVGCVPLYHLMEDAATAEISRAQIWQWIRHPKGVLEDGRKVTLELFKKLLKEELDQLKGLSSLKNAADMFEQIIRNEELEEFLTLRAYERLP